MKTSERGLAFIAEHEGLRLKASGKPINRVLADPAKLRRLIERFWPKVSVRGRDECWPWRAQARHSFGYGRMSAGRGVSLKAHQISWAIHNGPIPSDMEVRHRCDNPSCCNPKHLELGTHKQNMEDARKRGRASAPPRHVGDAHPNMKIPVRLLPAIRRDTRAAHVIASEHGVCEMTIYRIRRGGRCHS